VDSFFSLPAVGTKRSADLTTHLMIASFASSIIASFGGGTFHGFSKYLNSDWSFGLWLLAMMGIGLTGTFLLLAAVRASDISPMRRKVWWWVALVSGGLFVVAITRETTLEVLGVYYGPVIGAATWLHLLTWLKSKTKASGYFLIGVVVALISGAVQKYNLGFGENFNGNDLCHIIFMVSMYLFYRGALE